MPLYAPARPSAPTAATTATVTGSTANDVQVTDGPTDTISELRFSGQANHLASASWDGKVFVYDHTQVPSGTPVAQMDFDKPVLTCDWSPVRIVSSLCARAVAKRD